MKAKALLVDYGGVLTTSVLESFGAFCRDEAIPAETLRDVFLASDRLDDSPFRRVEVGAMTDDEFDRAVALLLTEACGRQIAHEGLKRRLFARTVPDTAMRAAVKAAREAGVRTCLLSNSWGVGGYPLRELDELFDELVISGEVKLRKPDPAIFELAAGRLGVEPRDCVFVDDFRVNCEGASAVGMHAILHRETPETIAHMQDTLGVQIG